MSAALGGLVACKKTPVGPVDDAGPSRLGAPVRAYGQRAETDKSMRWMRETKTPEAASSSTPLQDSCGIITPSSLHFERHHAGVPRIDVAAHKLLIHGLVERPLVFTMDEIRRLPSVSRILFIECAGNSGSEWGPKTARDAQQGHGLASCSEWTGVPLSLLLAEAGVKKDGKWIIAEGADACKMARSLPIAKAMDDILVAYGQNGEALRPEQGYPLRLVTPGWEGNVHVKWVHRIKVVDQPYMTRDETSHYTDLLADGTARQFTFEMEAKSLITFPSGGHKLNGTGWYEISGLAWSGRGRIERVEVSSDGGRSWSAANLQEPRLKCAFTRFGLPWKWDGVETTLLSRAIDETGYVQPSRAELVAVRGLKSQYHNNCIKEWRVSVDGAVRNVDA